MHWYVTNMYIRGMLSTELLQNTIHCAQNSGYHNQVMPPSKDLNSEIVDFFLIIKNWTSRVHKLIRLTSRTCEPYLTTCSKRCKHGLWWPRTDQHQIQANALCSKKWGAKGIWSSSPTSILKLQSFQASQYAALSAMVVHAQHGTPCNPLIPVHSWCHYYLYTPCKLEEPYCKCLCANLQRASWAILIN